MSEAPIYNNPYTVCVYLDDGRVFEYQVPSSSSAREHAAAIVTSGYRTVSAAGDYFEHYPPHRILKVKVLGHMDTKYTDTVRGT